MTSTGLDVHGPLFLSYRQADGSQITASLAWLLRAAGVPVWRDRDDLPPGDTIERLEQAIDDGISGAVLVVTDDVTNSNIVRQVEAPRLIELHRSERLFSLSVLNAVTNPSTGDVDYSAPDRLLGRPRQDLAGVLQRPSTRQGQLELVRAALWDRVARHKNDVATQSGTLAISVQSRNVAQVFDRTSAQLDIRCRPSAFERLPDPEGLEDIRQTLALIPDAIVRSGAKRVQVSGGAHLTIALALGAAMPSSRVGEVEVIDQRQVAWLSGSESVVGQDPLLAVDEHEDEHPEGAAGRPRVAVYVDLLPTRSESAFERYLEEHSSRLRAHSTLRLISDGLIDPSEAGVLAAEIGARIRQLSAANGNAEVDLLLRVPFPIAVLVGRLTNTLRLRAFEWDDSEMTTGTVDFRPRFVETLELRASAPGGPIVGVPIVAFLSGQPI